MTYQSVRQAEFPELAKIVEKIIYLLPMLILFYPLLLWPLAYPGAVDETNGLVAPKSSVNEHSLNKIYYPFLFILSVAGMLAFRPRFPRVLYPLIATLSIVMFYFALTTFWSLAPAITSRRITLEALICATILFSAVSVSQPQKLFVPLVWLVIATMAINLAAVLVLPTGPIGHPGIYNHKNTLGASAAMSILICLFGITQGDRLMRIASIITVPVCFFILLQSQSKTATGLAIMVPAMGVFFYVLCHKLRINFLLALLATIAIALSFLVIVASATDIRAADVFLRIFGDETFSGRTIIWQWVWEKIGERPWLGYGYEGFWDIGPSSPKFRTQNFIARMPHSHNGYLESILQTGFTGLTLVVTFLLAVISNIGKTARTDPGIFICFSSMLLYVLLNNMMETDVFAPLPTNWNFLVLTATISARVWHMSRSA